MTLFRKREAALPDRDTAQEAISPPNFEAIFQQHWTRVCSVLFRLTGDRAEAEDLALEVFWQLYRRPPAQDGSLGGWLYRVATRLGLNALRARRRRQKYETEAGALHLEASTEPGPEAALEQRQERERVRLALGRLKPRSAQILILRYSGLSYAEIAEATGVAAGSVGALLARAEDEFERSFAEGKGKDAR